MTPSLSPLRCKRVLPLILRAANVKVPIFIDDYFPKPEPAVRSRNKGKRKSLATSDIVLIDSYLCGHQSFLLGVAATDPLHDILLRGILTSKFMLRSIRQLYGKTLRTSNGDIGHVKDFYFNDQQWAVRYVIADTGTWLLGRLVLISPRAIGNFH